MTSESVKSMSQRRSHEKGRNLEKAVELITTSILEADPRVKGTNFTIERNKKVTIDGVRHEIDVFVKTLPGSDYESIWIFECKNWKEPVGKNEVTILSDKVRAIGANKGFLVARTFSKDARAKAAADIRIKLVECTDDFVSPLVNLQLFHSVCDFLPIRANVQVFAGVFEGAGLNARLCIYRGAKMYFRQFVDIKLHEMVDNHKAERDGEYQHLGVHWGHRIEQFDFNPGELLVDGLEIQSVQLEIRFFNTVEEQKLISKFELLGQGRAYSFEPIKSPGEGRDLEIALIHRTLKGSAAR